MNGEQREGELVSLGTVKISPLSFPSIQLNSIQREAIEWKLNEVDGMTGGPTFTHSIQSLILSSRRINAAPVKWLN